MRKFDLMRSNSFSKSIIYDESGTCGTLIDRSNENLFLSRHFFLTNRWKISSRYLAEAVGLNREREDSKRPGSISTSENTPDGAKCRDRRVEEEEEAED